MRDLADERAQAAGVSQKLGAVTRGAIVSAILDARGAECEQPRSDAPWTGAPLTFAFAVDAAHEKSVAQALITIRILVDGAQVGAIAFVRPLAAPTKREGRSKLDSQEKLRRVERVFLSYSSADRETVGMLAAAYRRAGIACFFDRVGLKSGEEWHPRLLKEISRADLFHLCWSQSAARSPWVEQETKHAMVKRKKSWSKRPEITIQMLDGPPWAAHPGTLDALNFDDYARAAIVERDSGRRAARGRYLWSGP